MDGLNEEVGDGIMFAPLMPAEVLGSGTGSLSQIGQETIKSGGGTRASSATTSKKPIRKRPVGEGKSTSKKRARSESDIDKGDNLHPRPKMSYAQLAALALRSDEKNEASVGEIYKWIMENYPYYKHGAPWWKNCIRHNLSMKSCFIRTETEQRAFWSLDYEQADQIFNAEKRSAATWQQSTGGKISGASAVLGHGVGATIANVGATIATLTKSGHRATVASLSAAASRKAAKSSAGAAKEMKMKAPKKAKESKPKKGFKNMGSQTLQSSKSTQTDITLATMNALGLPDISYSTNLEAAFPNGGGGGSRKNSSLSASRSNCARPVVLRTPRGAFSSSFDTAQRLDHQGLSLNSATYPGDLELPNGLDEVDPADVKQFLNDVPYGEDDDDDDDDGSGGLRIDPLAQSWGGFPTNWKDQKGSFESLF